MNNMFNEILMGLTNTNVSLEDSLLKLKIFAFRLKNEELINFIDFELNGYKGVKLPEYRVLDGILIGTLSNGYWLCSNRVLATAHLKKYKLQDITICEIKESVSVLQSYLDSDENNLSKIIPPEYYNKLSETYDNGFFVQTAYVPISKAQISGILTSIREKLIDLMLTLENEFDKIEIENLFYNPTKEQIDKATFVINQFFINSFGSSVQNTKIELENDK